MSGPPTADVPLVLVDLAMDIAHELQERSKLPAHVARRVATGAAMKTFERWAGTQLYIPKSHQLKIRERDLEIFLRHEEGAAIGDLAAETGLTKRSVRRAIQRVRSHRDAQRLSRQSRLPLDFSDD